MTTFHIGRHRAPRTTATPTFRAGAGVLAAAALGLGAAVTAPSASANAGGPTGSTSAPAPSASDAPAGDAAFSGLVRSGDSGVVVKQIQQIVGAPEDGAFGPVTEEAVRDYQRDQGLVVDGIVGPKTGSAMGLTGGAESTGSTGSTDSDSTTATSSTQTASADSSVLDTAASLVGTPYSYGGASPSEGFDCSGFTQYVFAQNGIDIPRVTTDQQAAATPVSDPQPGDLVFFGSSAYHVGIYAGDGMMYDSGTEGSTVTKREIWTDDVTYGRF